METREHLRLWKQSSWPEDDFSVGANHADLVDLEERHVAGRAYTYAVLNLLGTESLGCVYVFPTSAPFLTKATVTPVDDALWADVQAVVYFWVRRSPMETGFDGRLLAALRPWSAEAWGVERTVFVTNEQFTQQVDLIERTDLTRRFELVEPGKPGTYLAFG
ncbi:N-acetyltransferase [Promicromonospora sp. Populi]|uniref:N-acetyltransferase n=1 Tax=Promicromonospora sp. Populi TaxID=3239420 RepID=UPI0034E1ECD7